MNLKFLSSSSYYPCIVVNLSVNNMVYAFLSQRLLLCRFSKVRKKKVVLKRHGFPCNRATLLASDSIPLKIVAISWSIHLNWNTFLPGKWAMISFNSENSPRYLNLPWLHSPPPFFTSNTISPSFWSSFAAHLTFDLSFHSRYYHLNPWPEILK